MLPAMVLLPELYAFLPSYSPNARVSPWIPDRIKTDWNCYKLIKLEDGFIHVRAARPRFESLVKDLTKAFSHHGSYKIKCMQYRRSIVKYTFVSVTFLEFFGTTLPSTTRHGKRQETRWNVGQKMECFRSFLYILEVLRTPSTILGYVHQH